MILQVSLQSMLTGSAAGSFTDDILKWQKRLQTIEAVLTVWLDVQEKWVELEDVCQQTVCVLVTVTLISEPSIFNLDNL